MTGVWTRAAAVSARHSVHSCFGPEAAVDAGSFLLPGHIAAPGLEPLPTDTVWDAIGRSWTAAAGCLNGRQRGDHSGAPRFLKEVVAEVRMVGECGGAAAGVPLRVLTDTGTPTANMEEDVDHALCSLERSTLRCLLTWCFVTAAAAGG